MKLYIALQAFWKCKLWSCRVGLRVDNCLQGSHMPFVMIVHFLYSWYEQLASVVFFDEQLNIYKEAVVDWIMYVWEICLFALSKEPGRQIRHKWTDSGNSRNLFTQWENNAGRLLMQQWIFNGLCEDMNKMFFEEVTDHSVLILLKVITQKV